MDSYVVPDDGFTPSNDSFIPPKDTYTPPEDTYTPPPYWTDPDTGFTWQEPPAQLSMDWSEAKQYCDGLAVDGGGWHLPTVEELRTLIVGCPATETGGSCNVGGGDCLEQSCRADSCVGCTFYAGPADGGCYWPDELQGNCYSYWTSSAVEDKDSAAWHIGFFGAYISPGFISDGTHVRCAK